MKTQHYIIVFAILLLTVCISADTTFVNEALNFSAYFPDNWAASQITEDHVTFHDTTGTCSSQITIKRYLRNPDDFATSEDWTRAHFIAYLLVVRYSWDPFGAILYYDSTINSVQGTLWAPEAFCEFYSVDTSLGSWNEYIRYTAQGDYGYEIYAIGDTTDMEKNIGLYSAIIQLIDIEPTVHIYRPNFTVSKSAANFTSPKSIVYDLKGKRQSYLSSKYPSGVYIRPSAATLNIKVR